MFPDIYLPNIYYIVNLQNQGKTKGRQCSVITLGDKK